MNSLDPAPASSEPELSEEDKIQISEIFHEDIVPKLLMMHARNGTISCEFAGEAYKSWLIEFRSNRAGLEIVGFEYDPDARSFALPRPISRETS